MTPSDPSRRIAARAAIALLVGLALGTGCEHSGPSGTASPSVAASATRTAVPRRIVSLGPSSTELVFALGAGERLVGATSACDWPPAARSVPRVGGYGNPQIELVLARRPDIVLVPAEGALREPAETLRRLGLRVQPVTVTSIPQLFEATRQLAATLGREQAGARLVATLRARLERVAASVRGLPRPRVLVVVGHEPLVVAGRHNFLDEALRLAGARNALETADTRWPTIDGETLLALDPDAIVDVAMDGADEREARLRWWRERFGSLRAVAQHAVLLPSPDLLVRPGPRLVDGIAWLAQALHEPRRGR
ncbi:MAG: hypothetical protein D6776_00170 [Planctomycetota bacterium]|nr:MAG: hypothetical protein D6776_00170 [Planctomycetota bacterium]